MLRTVATVIVDEIHALVARQAREPPRALARAARGAARAARPADRPLGHAEAARGRGPLPRRRRPRVRARRRRARSASSISAIEVPPSPLSAVCSHEQWEEIYARMAELVREHRTTLVFVNTRKMAERIAAQLSRLLGEDAVTSHHGSLSRGAAPRRRGAPEGGQAPGARRHGVARARHRHRRRRSRHPGRRHALDRDVPPARRARRATRCGRSRRAGSSR